MLPLFPHVNWTRSKSSEYPKVWHTFEVKKRDSDEFEQYRIEDLPESRTDDALAFMDDNFCKEEPLSQAYQLSEDHVLMELQKHFWKCIIKRKAALVCFKNGSNEIVGININMVVCKYDVWNDGFNYIEELLFDVISFFRYWRSRYSPMDYTCQKLYNFNDIFNSITENFNEFKHYGVNTYLTGAGLAVAGKYRGLGIGVQLLKTREKFCNEFGIKLTLNRFSSNYSNACADKAGFKLERISRYDAIRHKYPHLPYINSDVLTLKYMKFPLENE